jgi:hypothetical protein
MWPFSIWKISGHYREKRREIRQRDREMIKAGSHQVVGKAEPAGISWVILAEPVGSNQPPIR